MRSCRAWVVVLVVGFVVVTDCHPSNDKRLYQNQERTADELPRANRMNGDDAKDDTNALNLIGRRSTKPYKKEPMVDDDLLEFLVRVADSPAEWNKIQRVLNMLGRDETAGAQTAEPTERQRKAAVTTATAAMATATTTAASGPSWPSGDWIMEMAERTRAEAVARGIGAGGAPGPDPFDYDDGGDDDDDDDEDDEFEEIDEPTTPVAVPAAPPRTHQPRGASGHMSRYQFRRIDGRPDDGRVNGTYVAVVESDRSPPRGAGFYDPARQNNPKSSE